MIFGSWFVGKGYSEMSNLAREKVRERIQKTLGMLSRVKNLRELKVSSGYLISPVFLGGLL